MSTVGYVLLGLLFAAFLVGTFRIGARRARTCQLCRNPRDPNSKEKGSWEYGVLACDACAKKLEARFKDEPLPREPPPWARP